MQIRGIQSFIANFNNHVLGLSFKVYNVSLAQMAQNASLSKHEESVLFSEFKQFELRQVAISEPVDLGKRYIPQKKAPKHSN